MSEMATAYFAGARELLRAAKRRKDTEGVDKIMDEAFKVVDELYERMPPDPPYRDYAAPPKK